MDKADKMLENLWYTFFIINLMKRMKNGELC